MNDINRVMVDEPPEASYRQGIEVAPHLDGCNRKVFLTGLFPDSTLRLTGQERAEGFAGQPCELPQRPPLLPSPSQR